MKDEHKPASAHEMVSKRLVEYFLVYSCKPKRRNKDKDKDPNDKKNDGQQNHDHDRGHGGKGKGGTKTDSNRSFGKRMNEPPSPSPPSSSPEFDRRASSRAVHLTVASDGGIIGNSLSQSSADVDPYSVEEDRVTPLMTNRKTFEDGDSKFKINSANSDDMTHITLASSFRGTRIPATEDSGVLSETDDEDPTTDVEADAEADDSSKDIHIQSTRTTKASVPIAMPVTPPRRVKYGEDDDDIMTPSRARAAMDSDSDDNCDEHGVEHGDENGDERGDERGDEHGDEQNMKPLQNNLNGHDQNDHHSSSPVKTESQNVHLPRTNSAQDADDQNNPLAAEFSLEPVKTAQYPLDDRSDCPLNPMVSHFCFPQVLSLTTEYQMPRIHYFVLTNDKGKKMYGTCLTVWETYEDGADSDLSALLEGKAMINTADHEQKVEVSLSYDKTEIYIPKVLCILSSWPYLHSFREYLAQLYRLATMTDLMEVPIERYIMNICDEAPAPPPGIFELRLKVSPVFLCTYVYVCTPSTPSSFMCIHIMSMSMPVLDILVHA
jgi:hypothetical protein